MMKEMKRSALTPVFIFLLFFFFFFVHQITVSSFQRLSAMNLTMSQAVGKKLETKQKSEWSPPPHVHFKPTRQISCDRSHQHYDLCTITGPTMLDPATSTLFLLEPTRSATSSTLQKVRPYPRKWENDAILHIKEITLTSGPSPGPTNIHCKHWHKAPALLFSAGGYTGNLFHDFNDGFIPLFITTRSLFANRNLVLVIADCRNWWLSKYAELLPRFTRYPIINLNNDTNTHCFSSATVGLISHGYMTIDPALLPHSETFLDFRALLETAYMHGNHHFYRPPTARPRLVFVSRAGNVGRVIVNQAEVVNVAEEVGFEVVIFEPTRYTSLNEAYGLINASHAIIGVHGAALTHSLFLRPGFVFMQVVPIGIEWLAETCFGKPARDMGLVYMEYRIRVNESSLVEKYGRDNLVLKDPKAVVKEAWSNTKEIYLKNQDVKLDLVRVGRYLKKAYEKAKRFMEEERVS